jgi:hypothetical protein
VPAGTGIRSCHWIPSKSNTTMAMIVAVGNLPDLGCWIRSLKEFDPTIKDGDSDAQTLWFVKLKMKRLLS